MSVISGHHFVGYPAVCKKCHLSLDELKLFSGPCGNLVAIPATGAQASPPNMEELEKALAPLGLRITATDVTHHSPGNYSVRIEAVGLPRPLAPTGTGFQAAGQRLNDSLVDAAVYLHRTPDPGTKMVGLNAFVTVTKLTVAKKEVPAARRDAVAATGWKPPVGTPCECGAQKLGHARGPVGHSRWCPWSQG